MSGLLHAAVPPTFISPCPSFTFHVFVKDLLACTHIYTASSKIQLPALGSVWKLYICTSISKSPVLVLIIPFFSLPPHFSFLFTFVIPHFCPQEQLDVALSKTCKNFDVSHYTKVQLAYTLLGKTQVSDLTCI